MLAGITPKCWILALVVRDDGERILLGDGAFEFQEKQQHFIANTYVNDTVEVQGNDGVMLAGQVRRSAAQSFDGYIADGTVGKTKTEEYRRQFLSFFRKNHFYTVVYILPDGTAAKRQKGFIVDAPEVKELWQISPEYHVSLNFEDVNYYLYAENQAGEEIYSDSAIIPLVTASSGGLVWDETGVVWDGTVNYQINALLGDTTQQTYSGKNLFSSMIEQGGFDSNGAKTASTAYRTATPILIDPSTQYSLTSSGASAYDLYYYDSSMAYLGYGYTTARFTSRDDAAFLNIATSGTVGSTPTDWQLELGSTASAFEPYVGGTPAPNPDYPQPVQTATGRQVLTLDGQEYEVNLGKNLFDKNAITSGVVVVRTDGTTTANTAYAATDYIEVEPGAQYTFTGFNYWYTAVYDQSKNYLGTVENTATITIPAGGFYLRSTVLLASIDSAMFEKGSTSTSYAPYITTYGKNLLDSLNGFTNGYITGDGTVANGGGTNALFGYISVSEDTDYTMSSDSSCRMSFAFYDASKTFLSRNVMSSGETTSRTVTTPNGCAYVRVWVYRGGGVSQPVLKSLKLQLEEGPTATAYEPCIPGPIELCKIGNYQDYIYKQDGDWYVHKEIGKAPLTSGDSSWYRQGSAHPNGFTATFANVWAGGTANLTTSVLKMSDHYHYEANAWTGGNGAFGITSTGVLWLTHTEDLSLASFKTWLDNNNPIIYAPLATPAEVQITNANLVAQLEALTAVRYESSSVTSPYLPVILDEQTSVLSGAGAEWDGDGGGGATDVVVDSIDNVYPVLTIIGPATNPSIENVTTGTALSYSGNITSEQTLEIDMNGQTARLNGTNVISNLTGDWLYFSPGTNKVAYSTSNNDAPDAKIEWSEIIG